MGKTSKPLTLLVADELAESEPIKKLAAQGHIIHPMTDIAQLYDLILAPNAQLMTEAHLRYLPEAIRRARVKRYAGKLEEADTGTEGVPDGGTDLMEAG
jgi:hypothetical protein